MVVATRGYPGKVENGSVISGLDRVEADGRTVVFHAGTARDGDGNVVACGGRVLGVTASGTTVAEAQAQVYAALEKLDWPEGFYRRDIGWRALARD